jgi:hypothetical protein
MPFLVDGNPTPSDVSDAINYLLANLAPGTPAGSDTVNNNTTTGFISNTRGDLIQYQYRYIGIRYADSPEGLNFSDNPFSRLYFGINNTDTVSESSNPADYTWFEATGGFGSTKVLWIVTSGGRHATFAVSQESPDTNQNWRIVPNRSVDLDNPFATFNQFMSIKFATNSIGTTGFGDTITNATYYGVSTSVDGSTSLDPTDYEWSPYPFGTTYSLFYRTFGGRNISFAPALFQPIGNIKYVPGTVLNLDVVTLGAVNSLGIISLTPFVVESPFRYLLVQYGTSENGAGISTDPTGKTYFGLQASDVLTIDTNPADYQWFAAGGTFLTDVNLWARTTGGTTATLSLTLEAPDTSGWQDITGQTTSLYPNIDVYARSGIVVVDVTSPTAGRIGFSSVDSNGIVNLNLDPYGQGRDTGGFTINPAAVASITFDEFGRVVQSGALDQVRYSSMLTTATAGQTVFTFSNPQPNQVLAFRNGAFLVPGSDFTRTSSTVTFTSPCVLNDKIALYYIRLIDGGTSADKVPFVTSTQTLTSGQTEIITSYVDGSEVLFLNGALLVDTDYGYRGTNTGYILNTASTGGTFTAVAFSFNNGNVLIFAENFTTTNFASTAVSFPTQFYRNSHLMWLNGCLLRPGSDYTMSGVASLINSLTLVGSLSFSGQPVQFVSFNSTGEASMSSLSSAGVIGMDMPVVIDREPTMLDMFQAMQTELDKLKSEVEILKGIR